MKTIKVLSVLLLFTFNFKVDAKQYHVSVNGSNTNPGTLVTPFRTISFAAEIAAPGDTITVHQGIYREWIKPENGGSTDLNRIVYQAAGGEEVIIKGSEIINNWQKHKGSVWKVVIPNAFFNDYNPYKDELTGDWFNKKETNHHTGEVFLNGISLFEKSSLDDVMESNAYPDARNKEASIYTWFCEVGENNTTIWANFQKFDPNKELVEINVRQSCFYPTKPGVNYLTICGFIFDQAATQWAAPTAEQIGLVGTHWSKGWIIEDNIIRNSKCVGIALGKDRGTGQNVWMNNPQKDGATHYNEVIFRALEIGWSKEKIGSHIVRNNEIYHCEQAGIVGSLGGVYSKIYNNNIHDIWIKRIFSGAEMAGIKIHASIDMVIENNKINNTGRGIWLDWMAQGTRVSGNLLYDNTTDDFFSEVNHGPYLVDNNIFLSEIAIRDWSGGGAFVHNIIAGRIQNYKELSRFTPYHLAHSTKVAGLRNIHGGDNRFFNNIFIKLDNDTERIEEIRAQFYGLHGYRISGIPNIVGGNIFYNGAKSLDEDANLTENPGFKPSFEISEKGGEIYLTFEMDELIFETNTSIITTEKLGTTLVSEAIFENSDGTPYILDKDYHGNNRNEKNPLPGPFGKIKEGINNIKVW